MRIVLNGEPRDAADNLLLSELLVSLQLDSSRVAVEVNEKIVPRARHATHSLKEGDRLEVVTFVGGG